MFWLLAPVAVAGGALLLGAILSSEEKSSRDNWQRKSEEARRTARYYNEQLSSQQSRYNRNLQYQQLRQLHIDSIRAGNIAHQQFLESASQIKMYKNHLERVNNRKNYLKGVLDSVKGKARSEAFEEIKLLNQVKSEILDAMRSVNEVKNTLLFEVRRINQQTGKLRDQRKLLH